MTIIDLDNIARQDILTEDDIDGVLSMYEHDEDYPEDNPRLDLDEDELELLEQLEMLRDDLGHSWRYGVTLINEDYFEDHARDVASDLGGYADQDWPLYCIDWKRAAQDLMQDYTPYEIDGVTFYTRD